MLLLREICENQIEQINSTIDDEQEKFAILTKLTSLCS